VAEVSNIYEGMRIRPAALPAEQNSALALILGSNGRLASEGQIADFVRLADQRRIDLSRIQYAEITARLVWAVLPVVNPGRTILLLAPNQMLDQLQAAPAAQVVEQVCADYAGRGFHLAQALVDPLASDVRSVYLKQSFTEMAELIYLQATIRRPAQPPQLPPGFFWHTYSSHTHAFFMKGIIDSYEQSLDCPALNGLREVEDVIQGHQAAGAGAPFDPLLWRVLMERSSDSSEHPRGVLLLTRTDLTDAMELVYVGLAASARRRGLGTIMMKQAMATALADNRRRLTLAVDSRNGPALRLYFRHGLQKIGSKIALMRDLRRPGAAQMS
jgi:mycothiol synthase